MTKFTKGKINLRQKLKELERPSVDKLVTKDHNGSANIDILGGDTKLESIDNLVSSDVYDVFVYDTRKDSDGGAWRHRTQHTSWYNTTNYEDDYIKRGSRKDFPAVAILVACANGLEIYDADNPRLPLWVRFYTNSRSAIYITPNPGALAALNGVVFVGANNGGSGSYLSEFGFIHDRMRLHQDGGKNQTRETWINGMVQKANGSVWKSQQPPISISNDHQLVDRQTNAVAMTVLPGAPIDEVSGLPRPTIAVATDSGVSVIKDSGRVFDLRSSGSPTYDKVRNVKFTKDNKIVYTEYNGGTLYGWMYVHDIPSEDMTISLNSQSTALSYYDTRYPMSNFGQEGWIRGTSNYQGDRIDSIAVGDGLHIYAAPTGNSGVTFIEDRRLDDKSSLMAYVTKDFNTGWMYGDIQRAWLSATDPTDLVLTESNLLLNSTFDNLDNWTGATNGVLTNPSNRLRITNTGGPNGRAMSNTFSTTVGKRYSVRADFVDKNTGSTQFRVEIRQSGADIVPEAGTTVEQTKFEYHWTSVGTGQYFIELYCLAGDGNWVEFDNVYVHEVDPDHTRFIKGLGFHGTITRTPVATGADLVAYSGFSNSTNYLSGAFSGDLAPGNGDFSCVGWFKKSTSSNTGMIVYITDGANQTFDVRVHTDMKMLAQITDDGFSTREIVSTSGQTVNDDQWHQFHAVRRSNRLFSYLDAKLLGISAKVEANITNSQRVTIGAENPTGNAKAFEGSLALIRWSNFAPTEEQITKMYEDEKHLFQENAKCTLYGSSDAVTALGYDEDTKLLHVGTSSGRSDFQGLRRINNTTTAVTTAISASDELIAEQ